MLRRRFITIANGLYRWLRVKATASIKRKTDLKSATAADTKVTQKFKMERKTDLTARLIGDLKLSRGVKTSRKVNLEGSEPADITTTKAVKAGRKTHLVTFYIGQLKVLKKFPTFRKANLDTASTETLPEVSKKLHTKSGVTFGKANPEHTNVQSKIMTQSSLNLDHTSPSGIAVACELPKLTCTAPLDYWFMPEIDEDGVLHIKQVSSAVINGDTLEVR